MEKELSSSNAYSREAGQSRTTTTDYDPIAAVASRWPAKPWKRGEAQTWRIQAERFGAEAWARALELAHLRRMEDTDAKRRRMCPDLAEIVEAARAVSGGRYAHLNDRVDDGASGPPAKPERAAQWLAECRQKLGRSA